VLDILHSLIPVGCGWKLDEQGKLSIVDWIEGDMMPPKLTNILTVIEKGSVVMRSEEEETEDEVN